MRYFFGIIVISLFIFQIGIPSTAQDNDSTAYDIALQRIEEAASTNATDLNLTLLGATGRPPEIAYYQLTELPPEIWQLSQLQSLNLSDNNLNGLPPEIKYLTNLRRLDLGNNFSLGSLPAEIGNLTQLEVLILNNTRLSSLPAEIGNLSQLDSLYLSGNNISTLPPNIGNVSSLRVLDLSSNFTLTTLPMEMGKLQNLEYLMLFNSMRELQYPPHNVAQGGTQAILEFLREELERVEAEKMRSRLILIAVGVVMGLAIWFLRRRTNS